MVVGDKMKYNKKLFEKLFTEIFNLRKSLISLQNSHIKLQIEVIKLKSKYKR